ncbi:MAG: hypothetical protein ACRAVC_21705 [Trichormus sp.]
MSKSAIGFFAIHAIVDDLETYNCSYIRGFTPTHQPDFTVLREESDRITLRPR